MMTAGAQQPGPGPTSPLIKLKHKIFPGHEIRVIRRVAENFDTLCLSRNFPLSNIYVSDGFCKILALIQGNKESSDIFYFLPPLSEFHITTLNITPREGF